MNRREFNGLIVTSGAVLGVAGATWSRAYSRDDPDPPTSTAAFVVLTVRGAEGGGPPYTLTEYDETGEALWGVIPGTDLAANVGPDGAVLDPKDVRARQGEVAALCGYLARLRKGPDAPDDLRVVITTGGGVGRVGPAALRCCLGAGFKVIRFTGYVPLGGEMPPLKPGPDGEAEGYRRYTGERVDTEKLLADYEKGLIRL